MESRSGRASAPAACARTRGSSGGPGAPLSDTAYIALGLLAGAIAAGVQYVGWTRLGGRRATTGSAEARRQALRRWILFAFGWQAAVLAFVGVYVGLQLSGHPGSPAWPAPAVGAVVGTALPLQVVVISLLRGLH